MTENDGTRAAEPPAALSEQAIVRGFDDHEAGESYDREKQEADWTLRDGSSATAAIAEISDEQSYQGGQSLKVTYSSDERVKTASKFELPEADEYYSSYWVRFDEDFSFNGVEKSGGKLPGLGSDEVPTGGDDVTGDNGFSARYMWRYDGQAELYLYHMDKAGTFGDSVKFQYDDGSYAFFETGTWHNITQRVKVNDGTSADGEIDVWLDGEQVVDIDGVRLSDNGQGVDVFYLSTFYGGGSADWLPPEDTTAYFDEIVISTDAADVGLDAADIRSPDENPDSRQAGDGVVRGIRPFEASERTQALPNGEAKVLHDKQWGDGYTATLFFTPDAGVSDWTVEVRTPGPIEKIWNAEIVSYDGEVYTLKGTTKAELEAGETANIRILGEGHGSLVEFADGESATPIEPVDPIEPVAPVEPDVVEPAEPTPPDPGGSEGSLPGGATVAFDVEDRWSSGFKGVIVVTNDGDTAVEGWSVGFDATDFAIRNFWGGDLLIDGDAITVDLTNWSGRVEPGESVSFGFVADGPAPTALSGLTVDGVKEVGKDSEPVDPDPVDPTPPDPTPVDPDPVEPDGDGGSDGSASATSPFTANDYESVLNKSMSFYYAQYAGGLPDDHPIPWRGDSVLDDGAEVGRDLSGGWFDAGDHVKFGFPMASTATMLAWGGLEFEDGYRDSGAYAALDDHLRHVTDYFLQAYDDKGTDDISDDVFHAQVGDGNTDHAYWGAPEDMDVDRPVYSVDANNPGSEVTAETAAALAASSMVFRAQGDAAYADELLEKAIKLYDFAETYQGSYSDSIDDVGQFYNSWSGFEDELSWGANWLYQATGDDAYLEKSETYWAYPYTEGAHDWDNKSNGVTLLLAEQTGDALYTENVDKHFDHWLNEIDTVGGTDTNDGLGWYQEWGSNRLASNTAFLATVQAKNLAERDATGNAAEIEDLLNFATDQVDFALGDNPDGQSFVVGFGEDFPLNPHHRAASGTTDIEDPAPNAYILEGALVGGPATLDGEYNDDRTDFVSNEVATDYNAGFSGALAGTLETLDGLWG